MTTLGRRSLIALAAIAGFASCTRLVLGSPHSYLPIAFGHPRVIYDSGLGDYFFMYQLTKTTISKISAEGVTFEGFRTPPRSKRNLNSFAKDMKWFKTPMFTGDPGALSRQLSNDASDFSGNWSGGVVGYSVGTNGHKLSAREQKAYEKLRTVVERPGNYFGFGPTSEAFGIVDVEDRLMLLTRGEI